MTNHLTGCADAATAPAATSLPDRVAAIELLLQQMLFLMDAQGTLTLEDLGQWMGTAMGRMRATGSVPATQVQALEALQRQVEQ